MVVAMGKAAEADPVLKVIERHRAALEVYDGAHEQFQSWPISLKDAEKKIACRSSRYGEPISMR
jgi:hypothetical protein